jgi:hypothetical protein
MQSELSEFGNLNCKIAYLENVTFIQQLCDRFSQKKKHFFIENFGRTMA